MLPPAGAAASAAVGCRFPRASSIAAVHLARPLTSQPLERACVMLSASDNRALGVLLSVSCTSVQPRAAERRPMLTAVNDTQEVHTSFPSDLVAIQS